MRSVLTDCRPPLEICHVGECDGLDEVIALLPPGQIWRIDRDSVYTNYIRALGHIKTELNKRTCAVWGNTDPCTSTTLQPYWAEFYSFPTCVPLTQEALCEWVTMVTDPSCPPGSVGFLQAAIDFVLPGQGVTLTVNYPGFFSNSGFPGSPCADNNALVITGPPSVFRYTMIEPDHTSDPQDGVNACREYYIPEIDCLRRCVFPLGMSIGQATEPRGPDGQDIFGVSEVAVLDRKPVFIQCGEVCNA